MAQRRCCKGCVAPKRHVGCHATCPEYVKENAQNEERMRAAHKEKMDTEAVWLIRRGRTKKQKGAN